MKEARVLLVKIKLGRGTAHNCPLNQDQQTKLFSVEAKESGHGYTIEMIPAIKKFGRYYRVICFPDGTEKSGDVFPQARHYVELNDSQYVRKGLLNFITKINREVEAHMRALQKSQKHIERYFESFI